MPDGGAHRIFISYSHRDRSWLDRLQVHLRPLERAGLLDRWDDTRIRAGGRWRDEIAEGLARADVAVLLVSADFLASDFIVSEELPALLQAEQARGLLILVVVLKPCRLSGTPLADIQTIHPADRPLLQMTEAEQESVWVKLAEEIQARVGGAEPGASILRARDNFPEAEDLLRRSIALEEQVVGTSHHDLASSLTMLGDVCRMQGKHDEAEHLLRRALDLDEAALGRDHPNVAWSLTGLAEVFAAQGRLAEAELHFSRALSLREQSLGNDHPMVRETRARHQALFGPR